jgi:hypothetical protein
MADGFTVDRNALMETAQGINDTIAALGKLGFDEEADVGRGFGGLALSGLQVGDAGLQAAFGEFCGRWEWGVRALVQDGNQIAQRLGLTAGAYSNAEQKVIDSIKDVVDAAAGDPHMSDAQAANASWSQDAAQVTGAQTPGGNMTPQQAEKAIIAQWKAEAGDVVKSKGGGLDGLILP